MPNLGIDCNRMNVGSIQMKGLGTLEDNGNPNREVERRDADESEEVVEIDCEQVALKQEVLTRGFRVVEVSGDVGKKSMPESINCEEMLEDTSEAKYLKLHRSRERAEKKMVEKERRSDRWELRNEREERKRKTNQTREVEVRKKVRLGPEPCDATHIFVEENLPSSVFGREMAPIVSEPFELPGSRKIKIRKSDFKKGKRGEVVQQESLTGNHLIHDNNQNGGQARKEDDIRAIKTETSNWGDGKSEKKKTTTKWDERKGSKLKDSIKKSAGGIGGGSKVKGARSGGGTLRCNCCAFEGRESDLLRHLHIHYRSQMKSRYQRAVDRNRYLVHPFFRSHFQSLYFLRPFRLLS